MSRDGANIYNLPFPDVAPNTTIGSAVYNGFTHDVAQDLNLPRPIVAGGTAATSADGALANLSAQKAGQVVTNYDSMVWISGSFYSATTATGEPVDGHAFSGIVYVTDGNNIVVEARDASDGKLYIRRKTAGVWGAWVGDTATSDAAIAALQASKVNIDGSSTMTGALVLPVAAPTLGTHATSKTYVDAINTALSSAIALKSDLASPTFTGDPKAPTPTAGDNDTSIATTAFVTTAVAGSIKSIKRQVFTASGTYTPSAGMAYCVIECIGGGAGGGTAHGSATSVNGGGGGGSGGYSRLLATAATIGASKAVTVGAAGAGGVNPDNNGSAGGQTSVGALCIANGGSGGSQCNTTTLGAGGAGGAVAGGAGDVIAGGAPGGHGILNLATSVAILFPSGSGGSSIMGGGALGVNTANLQATGAAATSYGSGGSGGQSNNNAAACSGGAGSAGLVIITEYCTS